MIGEYMRLEKSLRAFGMHSTYEEYYIVTSKKEILITEKAKIRSAILTDFLLSIEIVIIALGIGSEHSFPIQIITATFIVFLPTVGVYGIVILLVCIDDFGFRIIEIAKDTKLLLKYIGKVLVSALPKIIKILIFRNLR